MNCRPIGQRGSRTFYAATYSFLLRKQRRFCHWRTSVKCGNGRDWLSATSACRFISAVVLFDNLMHRIGARLLAPGCWHSAMDAAGEIRVLATSHHTVNDGLSTSKYRT